MRHIFATYTATRFKVSRKSLEAMVLAVAYSLFIVFFPWEAVSRAGFTDFEAYVEDFNRYSSEGLSKGDLYDLETFSEYLVSEVLWHELVRTLTDVTGEAAIALRLISFFIVFVWAQFLFKRVHRGLALLFLFNTAVIDIAMSGIRNGLGWALALVAFGIRSRALQAVIFLAAGMIHTTALVVVALYYVAEIATRLFKGRVVALVGIGTGVAIGLALTVASQYVVAAIGDRRTGEEYLTQGSSMLQASIWVVLLALQCMSGKEYIRHNVFVMSLLAWYLTMVPFVPWSFRVWACMLPLIAVSAFDLPRFKRQLFLFLYGVYLVLQYLYWSKLFPYWYPG